MYSIKIKNTLGVFYLLRKYVVVLKIKIIINTLLYSTCTYCTSTCTIQVYKYRNKEVLVPVLTGTQVQVLELLHMDKLDKSDKQILGINDIINIMLT